MMMKNSISLWKMLETLLFLIVITSNLAMGQSYSSWGNLEVGKFTVGFKTFKAFDSTRIYKPEEGKKYRPLLIHLWFPAKSPNEKVFSNYQSYIALETQRENFEENNSQFIDNYCKQTMYGYVDFGKKVMGNLSVTFEEILQSKIPSIINAEAVKGSFPLIIYAPSFGKSAIQNNVVCEYLASHGYIVAAVASAGENSQVMTNDEQGVMAQVKDLEFVATYLKTKVNFSKIGTLGYSWGGFSNIIYQMRNNDVKAVASWDGSIEYQGYEIAQKMTDFKPEKMKVPLMFFSNKNEDWTQFPFFKSVPSKSKYLYRMKQLEHAEFVAYWTVFANTKANASTYNLESYKILCEKTLLFFDKYLKGKILEIDKLNNTNAEILNKISLN